MAQWHWSTINRYINLLPQLRQNYTAENGVQHFLRIISKTLLLSIDPTARFVFI
jgi:hypothetical protein